MEKKNQNSVILINKELSPTCFEMTHISKGELFVIKCTFPDNNNLYVLVTFHGDSNGRETIPTLEKIHDLMQHMQQELQQKSLAPAKLIFGLDANVYEHPGKKKVQAETFVEAFKFFGFDSVFGSEWTPQRYTTFKARTYLQPQLQKAVKSADKIKEADINPKDYILFYGFKPETWWIDNTGERYWKHAAFPTLKFQSDHGIVAATITEAHE